MFVNGLLQLIDAGVIKRRVFDDLVTQQAVNDGSLLPDDARRHADDGGFFLGPTRFYEQLRAPLARAAPPSAWTASTVSTNSTALTCMSRHCAALSASRRPSSTPR